MLPLNKEIARYKEKRLDKRDGQKGKEEVRYR